MAAPPDLAANLRAGHRAALARAITLIASRRSNHRAAARNLVSAGLALLVTAASASLLPAAVPAPDFVIKKDKVEAAVFLDAKLKADPALAANCLVEGRKWAEREHADNVEARRDEDPDLIEWRSGRDYSFLSIVAGRYVSVMRTDSLSFGHAASIDTILWDKKAGRRISIRPFFRETETGGATLTTMQTAIIAELKAAKLSYGSPEDEDQIAELNRYKQLFQPNLLKIGPVSLAPSTDAGKSSGLIFHYGLNVIGGYDAGPFDAFVPWKTLKPHLSPEGIRIFGGAQSKDQ
jgi:hypothetical protein